MHYIYIYIFDSMLKKKLSDLNCWQIMLYYIKLYFIILYYTHKWTKKGCICIYIYSKVIFMTSTMAPNLVLTIKVCNLGQCFHCIYRSIASSNEVLDAPYFSLYIPKHLLFIFIPMCRYILCIVFGNERFK